MKGSMEQNKILMLGAKGMLGQALVQEFSDCNVISWDKDDLDITSENQVKKKIYELMPDVIINAAAYTNVDSAENNQDLANLINGTAVGYIAKVAKAVDAVLVHYSTDYVFRGENKDGYLEDDITSPINTYGRSKLLGEQELQKNCDKYYLIRTSWLFGPNGKNFVDTILKLATEKSELKIVNDQHGKPTYTSDLAKTTKEILENNKSFGIYHVTNETLEEGITWYDFAKKAIEIKGLKTKVIPVGSDAFPTSATRPNYSVLLNTKIKPLRDWQEALEGYVKKNIL